MSAQKQPVPPLAVAVLALLVLGALFIPLLSGMDPEAVSLRETNAPPSSAHWWGTDSLGRDVFERVASGGRLSLGVGLGAMAIASLSGTHVKLGQAIQAEWKLLGIKVNLRVVDFATWRDLNFTKKDFDVFYNAYGSALDPDDTEYAKYHTGSPGNLVGLSDPQIDHDLEQGRHAVDTNERMQLYADYQRRMTQLLPDLFIGYDKVLIGANKRLKGLSVRPVGYDGNAYFDNAYLWSVN